MAQTFSAWIDTFIDEKGIDRENTVNVNGPSGLNIIPIGTVIDAMKQAPANHRDQMKKTLILIDFKNGRPLHYIAHLAQALAK